MKRDNNKNELFFKNIASSYAKKSGDELLKEPVPRIDSSSLDLKVKSRINKNRLKLFAKLLPVAACFVLIFSLINIIIKNNNIMPDSESLVFDFEFVSAKLPDNFTLQEIDYDEQKTIYYIKSDDYNEIILTVENFTEVLPADGLEYLKINGTDAYAKTSPEYNLLKYKTNNILYTLTSPYDFDDLLEISRKLI